MLWSELWAELGVGGGIFAWAFYLLYSRILRLEAGLRDTIGLLAFVARASLKGEMVEDDVLEKLIKTSNHPTMSEHLDEFSELIKSIEKRKQA